jgi:CSLREA domain-containing protein
MLVLIGASLSGTAAADAATLRVTATSDEPGNGRCSLREAIAAANSAGRRTVCGTASPRSNTIMLRSGRYMLSIARAGSDGNASGDLNLTGRERVTIIGAGSRATTINATGARDRAITVAPGARLTLVRLAITGGAAPAALAASGGGACAAGGAGGDGGGIFNGGTLALERVVVVGNRASAGGPGGSTGSGGCAGGQGGSGGGVYNRGRLTLTDSEFVDNRAGAGGAGGAGDTGSGLASDPGGPGGPGGSGGAIYSRGRLTVTASTIYGNRAGVGGAGGPGGGGGGPPGVGGPGGWGGGVLSSARALRLVNDTLFSNLAGGGGAGSSGGDGGNGGALAVTSGPGLVRNATVADNGAGPGGAAGLAGTPGALGAGAGLFVKSPAPAHDTTLQNTIVASSVGIGCAAAPRSAIANGGHDLSYGDHTCPGKHGDPRLGPLRNYGGPTKELALGAGSRAIGQVPGRGGHCPATDQRGVRRPQGEGCDIGAYEYALPKITIAAPFHGASYERGSRIRVRFRCGEGGIASAIASCRGTVAEGRRIPTGQVGRLRFVVTAADRGGHSVRRTVHYRVWEYVNPLKRVSGLATRRIDLGVDYGGFGPLLALGRGRVTTASNTDSGPPSCWTISCWPGGGIVVYRLLDGPFAGKYVYVAEHLTVTVRVGQTVRAGQQIATLYSGYPWSEFGWAAGPGPEALAIDDGHRCTCSDPGGWSSIEGRNMNDLLVRLGAPSGYLQSSVPNQSMPRSWPQWSR